MKEKHQRSSLESVMSKIKCLEATELKTLNLKLKFKDKIVKIFVRNFVEEHLSF